MPYIAENLLNQQFHAEQPNEKWLTNVTEFKWYEGMTVHKFYLSAILDLCDRRIVAYVLSERNDITLDKDGALVSFTQAKDGTDDVEFSRFVHEICSSMTDLAEEIIAAGGIPSGGEHQVPRVNSYGEMVQQYLNYFFEG